MKNIEIISNSQQETIKIAKKFASHLSKKDIIILTGELGAGKTKFVEGFLSYFNAMMIALAVCMIVIGSIASSILLDIRKPQFMFLDGKEITSTNANVNASITLGFVIAVLMGIGSIVITLFVSVPAMYIVLFGFGLPYMAIEVFRLFFKLEKRYRSIEA